MDKPAPHASTTGYWNGTVWTPHQWFIWKASFGHGRGELAHRTAAEGREVWSDEIAQSGRCCEQSMPSPAKAAAGTRLAHSPARSCAGTPPTPAPGGSSQGWTLASSPNNGTPLSHLCKPNSRWLQRAPKPSWPPSPNALAGYPGTANRGREHDAAPAASSGSCKGRGSWWWRNGLRLAAQSCARQTQIRRQRQSCCRGRPER